ncbi:hypothetical protein [uncultured Desulfovibrio sp.]|uniref:hypothetical protein n=1 Tax=uncultured Desulfovibrio sp. TaxID=167968 RepID=UPI00272AE97D|nr:hypothetical protein [uncultured Desulfovibrio sp.]
MTVNVARKGTISSAYIDELTEFCAAYGIDFAALRKGDRVTVEVEEDQIVDAEAERDD